MQGRLVLLSTWCMIKIFWGGRSGDTFNPPYEQLLPLPTPFLRRFWRDPLMTPHHPTSSIFHCYPLPVHHPSPLLKILIIHMQEQMIKTRGWKASRRLNVTTENCRLCDAYKETVVHILSGCKVLAGSDYLK